MTKQKVLEILKKHKGEYLSGEVLSKAVGVGRNAIWKAVDALRSDGVLIDAGSGQGYCLRQSGGALTASSIMAQMECDWPVTVIEQTDSTNAWLKRNEGEIGSVGVVVAKEQSGGKGRMGRSFYSPQGGIYCSVLLRKAAVGENFPLLTVAAAVAAGKACEAISDKKIGIKWVNDLILGDKKICGILCEASFQLETGYPEYVIIGTGLNLQMPQGGFPREISHIAGALFDSAPQGAGTAWCAAYLDALCAFVSDFSTLPFMQEYRARSVLKGKTVTVRDGDRMAEGIVKDIDPKARLILQTYDGKEISFTAGEAVTMHRA